MKNPNRCIATHNPGKWPYTARCIKDKEPHHEDHEDGDGKKWKAKTPLPGGVYLVTLRMEAEDVNELVAADEKQYPVRWGDPYDEACNWQYEIVKVEKDEPDQQQKG